jgi:hypothetical protein
MSDTTNSCTTAQTLVDGAIYTFTFNGADAAGNAAATVTSTGVTFDISAPSVSMSSIATNPTSAFPIPVTVTFSEPVTDFAITGITATNGTIGDFTPLSGTTYIFGLYPSSQGLVSADITAGVAHDAAGNGNTAATTFSRTYDDVRPLVSMSSTSANLTNITPIPVTVTFSKAVNGFISTDITTANGTVANFSGTGANYTFDLVPTDQGIVSADIAENVAQDSAGNWNRAASTFTRTFDNIPPAFSAVRPATGDYIVSITASSEVRFTSSETLTSGSIVMTRTGGAADPDSPHTCTLVGNALTSGIHTALDMSNTTNVCATAQSLVSGTTYSFTFSGTDAAGNTGTLVNTGITFDNGAPTLSWIGPVTAGGEYPVGDQPIQLDASASDNVGIDRVVFYRWCPVPFCTESQPGEGGTLVEIGRVTTSPYRFTLTVITGTNYLDPRVLVPGYNEIDAYAYDGAGNQSKYTYIWLVNPYKKVFLPLIEK